MTARTTVVAALSALYGLAHTREGFRDLPDGSRPYPHAERVNPAWHSLLRGVRVALDALDASPAADRAVTCDTQAADYARAALARIDAVDDLALDLHNEEWGVWCLARVWIARDVAVLCAAHPMPARAAA